MTTVVNSLVLSARKDEMKLNLKQFLLLHQLVVTVLKDLSDLVVSKSHKIKYRIFKCRYKGS